MGEERWELAVIGAGPAGYVGALHGARLGLRTAVVEAGPVGGTCLNLGCIPTKTLAATAEVLNAVRRAGEFGIEVGEVRVDFPRAVARQRQVVDRLRRGIQYLFKKQGVTVITGTARFLDPQRLAVTGPDGTESMVVAERFLIATGSRPAVPAVFGYDGERVITSDEALTLPSLPERLVILGGGVIGCEFASFFATLGTRVAIVELMDTILPMLDREVAAAVQAALRKRGVTIHTGVQATAVEKGDDGVKVTLNTGAGVEGERLLISIGRRAASDGLALDRAGVDTTPRGEIPVNDRMLTAVPHIAAAGDVTAGRYKLAHVASREAVVAVEALLGRETRMDYRAVPSVVFTSPEAAGVGFTEEEARASAERQGLGKSAVRTGKFSFVANGKALAGGEYDGFVKVVAGPRGELWGVHIVGPHASDLIAEATLALQAGLQLEDLRRTIHAHPTLAEALWEAAEAVEQE
ncbi:MAG: dihydrolipoyl dehydrogenase [Bacillota bacterium]|nr:dihydrolipoyl dehydrogenase [Bacillota bacterium]